MVQTRAMTSKFPPERGPQGEGRAGFRAQIKGATLADLVQMECLAGRQRAVRVTSESKMGQLYFRGGGLVHASTRGLTGEAAALEILSWSEGTFEPVDTEWPPKETIASGWQGLLLRAAQARDERSAQSVVALRTTGARTPQDGASPALPGRKLHQIESVEIQSTPLEVLGRGLRAEDFAMALRLEPDGSVSLNRGGKQEFADVVAYACRLSEVLGAQLGAERFVAMECNFKSGRCFLVIEPSGAVVALRPEPAADCMGIRSLLGL